MASDHAGDPSVMDLICPASADISHRSYSVEGTLNFCRPARTVSTLPPEIQYDGPWYTRLHYRRDKHYLTHHFFRTGYADAEIGQRFSVGIWRDICCYAYAPEMIPAATAEELAAQFTHDLAAFDLSICDLEEWDACITVDTAQVSMEYVLNILREVAHKSNIKLIFCNPRTFISDRDKEDL